jgi:hypothetical protein
MADNSTQNGTDTIATDDITTLNGSASSGVKVQRVKVQYGDDNTARDASASFPLPVAIRDSSRTIVQFYAAGVAAGTTGTETAISLTKAGTLGAAAAAGVVSLTPPSGKRFRITSMTFASRGHATATAQISNFTLRVNAGGAVTTSSTGVAFTVRTATPATALAWDRFFVSFNGDGPELVGDGTLQWGITANAAYTTNAPTWDVFITGYEYTP